MRVPCDTPSVQKKASGNHKWKYFCFIQYKWFRKDGNLLLCKCCSKFLEHMKTTINGLSLSGAGQELQRVTKKRCICVMKNIITVKTIRNAQRLGENGTAMVNYLASLPGLKLHIIEVLHEMCNFFSPEQGKNCTLKCIFVHMEGYKKEPVHELPEVAKCDQLNGKVGGRPAHETDG